MTTRERDDKRGFESPLLAIELALSDIENKNGNQRNAIRRARNGLEDIWSLLGQLGTRESV
jgi:hypothetical protein